MAELAKMEAVLRHVSVICYAFCVLWDVGEVEKRMKSHLKVISAVELWHLNDLTDVAFPPAKTFQFLLLTISNVTF